MNRYSIHGTYAYRTDRGKVRKDDEDRSLVLMNAAGEVLLVVADGMGGANKGDVASKMAIDVIAALFRSKKPHVFAHGDKRWLKKAYRKANKAIYAYQDAHPEAKGMGTTLVAALLSGKRLLVANVGDSRAYAIKDREGRQLTVDQTYVNFLLRAGKIRPEEALTHPDRHVLMNALGIYPSLALDIYSYRYEGESLLLCSDGLYNQLPLSSIVAIASTDERADQKALAYVYEANGTGGSDNIAVAYWEALGND